MKGFEESISAYIVQDPSERVLCPFTEAKPTFVSDQQWQQFGARAQDIIDDEVVPAYQQLFNYMVMDYLPNSRTSIGASELPNGADYYQNRIKHYTTLDLTPAEIHQMGLAEVKRIRNEMALVIEKLALKAVLQNSLIIYAATRSFIRKVPRSCCNTRPILLRKWMVSFLNSLSCCRASPMA